RNNAADVRVSVPKFDGNDRVSSIQTYRAVPEKKCRKLAQPTERRAPCFCSLTPGNPRTEKGSFAAFFQRARRPRSVNSIGTQCLTSLVPAFRLRASYCPTSKFFKVNWYGRLNSRRNRAKQVQ
ncbi:MAG TPA: hypothetical protein PKD31_24100, partial [Blastocatellia bacterium]|nr:hypothetical protein [Blastocatellia bacterium]